MECVLLCVVVALGYNIRTIHKIGYNTSQHILLVCCSRVIVPVFGCCVCCCSDVVCTVVGLLYCCCTDVALLFCCFIDVVDDGEC